MKTTAAMITLVLLAACASTNNAVLRPSAVEPFNGHGYNIKDVGGRNAALATYAYATSANVYLVDDSRAQPCMLIDADHLRDIAPDRAQEFAALLSIAPVGVVHAGEIVHAAAPPQNGSAPDVLVVVTDDGKIGTLCASETPFLRALPS